MSRSKIQLKNVISSDKVKIFETNQGVFIGNVEETSTFNNNTSPDNMFSMKDTFRSQLLSNYYSIDDLDIQTFNTTLSKAQQTGTSSDYITQYNADNLDYMSLTQIDGYGFLLSENTINGLRELSYSDSLSAYTTYNQQPNIFTYPPSSEITLSGDIGNMIPLYNLSGVGFNYMTEVDTNKTYFEFGNKLAFGNTTGLKNYLNENWDVESNVVSATSATVSATIDNTRNYLKIGSSTDGSLFFTYTHKDSYVSKEDVSIANSRAFDDYSLSATTLSGSLTEIPMSGYIIDTTPVISAITDGADYARRFSYIESIQADGRVGFDKYGNISGKKSNMYSINIQNANINENSELSTTEKDNIKKSVSNIIRNVIEACTPINTQLAKIYWNGD